MLLQRNNIKLKICNDDLVAIWLALSFRYDSGDFCTHFTQRGGEGMSCGQHTRCRVAVDLTHCRFYTLLLELIFRRYS